MSESEDTQLMGDNTLNEEGKEPLLSDSTQEDSPSVSSPILSAPRDQLERSSIQPRSPVLSHSPNNPMDLGQPFVSTLVDPNIVALTKMVASVAQDMQSMRTTFLSAMKQIEDAKHEVGSSSSAPSFVLSKRPGVLASAPSHATSSSWAKESKEPVTVNSRDDPKPMSALCKDICYVRAMKKGTPGSNGSMHYALRCMRKDIVGSSMDELPEFADSTNSLGCPYYYVDAIIDIGTSRARDARLETNGYYELHVPIPSVEGTVKTIHEVESYVLETVEGTGDKRYGVWPSSEGNYILSVRIFEKVKSKQGDSSKPLKPSGLDIIMVDEEGRHVSLSTNDEAYKRFTGTARVTFTPSVLTVVKGYKKIVYRCSSLVLSSNGTKVKAGLTLSQPMPQVTHTTNPEWDKLIAVVKSLVDSGIKPSVLSQHLINCTKPQASRPGNKPQEKVEEESEEEESEEEEESDEEEEDTSADLIRGGKGKQPAVSKSFPPKQTQRSVPSAQVLDPPGSIPQAQRPKAKFPIRG